MRLSSIRIQQNLRENKRQKEVIDYSEQGNWLAAQYIMPFTYSLRIPLTSISSAKTQPAPGPATIRLALIKASIEFYGIEFTRTDVFPIIRAAKIIIRPPENIGISTELFHIYKHQGQGKNHELVESIAYREHANAIDNLTIYIKLIDSSPELIEPLFMGIRYWGQLNSMACCVKISEDQPRLEECAVPLTGLVTKIPPGPFYRSYVTEFRDQNITWKEIMPEKRQNRGPFKLVLIIWPLTINQRDIHGFRLIRRLIKSS